MTKLKHNIHDKAFNKLMHQKTFVKALLKTYLPEQLVQKVDWSVFELERIEGRHIRSDLSGEAQADVLCRTKISRQTSFLYLHAEHQSTADPLIALRLLNYQTNFLLDYHSAHPREKLPLVISVLYYHGKPSPFPYSLDWLETFEQPNRAKIYATAPLLIDISQRSASDIQEEPDEIAGTEFIFKYIHAKDFTPHLRTAIDMLKTAPSNIREISLQYLMYAAQLEKKALLEAVHRYLPHDEAYVMNIAKQCEKQGMLTEKKHIAKKLLATKFNLEEIAQLTELEMPVIVQLKSEITDTSEDYILSIITSS